MQRFLILAILLLATVAKTAGQNNFEYSRDFKVILAKTKDNNSNLFYDKLLSRFKACDSTLSKTEMLSLLIGFTDKPEYKPYNIIETERLIYKLNDEGKFQQAYDTGILLLKKYPLSYQALYELAYSSEKLGMSDSAKYYLDLVAKIGFAMLYSGDGKTFETAMFALGPADGQHLLRGAGLGIGSMGSGKDKNGNFLDMLKAVTKNGDKIQMYFNIQHAVMKMFDGKSTEDFMREQKKNK